MRVRESGGRRLRQPGQVRKEAAATNSRRVVPAPTPPFNPIAYGRCSLVFRWPSRVGMGALAGLAGPVRAFTSKRNISFLSLIVQGVDYHHLGGGLMGGRLWLGFMP